MTLLEFTIDTTTPLLNEWQRMHWVTRSRTTTDFAWHIRSKVGRWNKPPIQSCVIYIERHSSMLPDWDGLYGGLKPLLDALVKNTPRNPKGLGNYRGRQPALHQAIDRDTAEMQAQGEENRRADYGW
jgi:hypothetical protein